MYTLGRDGMSCMTDLIHVIDTLTPSEIDKVKNYLEPDWWQPTTVFGISGAEENKSVRNNERICLHDTSEAANIIHDAMNKSLLKYRDELANVHMEFVRFPVPGTYRTQCYREGIQVLRYQTDQHYNWHVDQATDKDINEYHRSISIVLYLTDDFEGGRTVFPHRAYKPKAGQALIFPSNWCFPHKSEPVTRGEKMVAVTWYHSHYDFN